MKVNSAHATIATTRKRTLNPEDVEIDSTFDASSRLAVKLRVRGM